MNLKNDTITNSFEVIWNRNQFQNSIHNYRNRHLYYILYKLNLNIFVLDNVNNINIY